MDRPDLNPLKLLIADDHPLMLAGIRRMLERSEDIEILGEAHSGSQLLELIARRRPALVVMDLRMPDVTGVECIERIRSAWPAIKIVVLSAQDDRASIDTALRAGANAYVLKSVGAMDLASIIRQAASGSVFQATPPGPPGGAPGAEAPTDPLTDREQSVLQAAAAGLSTAAISQTLWVSENTTKFHLKNIYRKLGVANRASAVRYAMENQLVAT